MTGEKILVRKTEQLHGEVTLRGDKSISHRAIILAALSEGKVAVSGLSSGEDNRRTVKIFEQLGVAIRKRNQTVSNRGDS